MAEDFESALIRGIGALVAGNPREAALALRHCLRERPFDPIAHFDLAVACRLLGELPRALGHARVASELLGTAPARALYGVHLHLARKRGQARAQLEAAVALDPGYRLAAMYLALLDREEGQRPQALLGLQRALAPGPRPLPPLVAARVEGQLFDLQRGHSPQEPSETLWCSVAVVTEILLPDGQIQPLEALEDLAELGRPWTPPRPGPGRQISPEAVAQALHRARRVVALTGAGISSGSGLATRKQLWQRHDRDMAVSVIGFAREPSALWTAVRDFLSEQPDPAPNPAHDVLARLPQVSAIVTQNVDDLHQRAALPGSAVPVYELHGTLERMVCARCGKRAPHPARGYLDGYLAPPWCEACQAPLRPDVVLFGEQVPSGVLRSSLQAVAEADLLLVVGCAMDVAPASELPRLAAGLGVRVIELKRSPSRISCALGSELLLGPAEQTLPAVYAALAALQPLPPLPERTAPSPRPPRPALPVVLPALGASMTEATIARWVRAPGERVAQGEALVELDTDKVCVELEAPFSGVLRRLRARPGDTVYIEQILAEVEPLEPELDAPAAPPPAPPRPPDRSEIEEADEALFAPMGPHAPCVRAQILALDEARWLLPEDSPALRSSVLALIEQHSLALRIAALGAWFSDDRREVLERWKQAWAQSQEPPDEATAAWERALLAASQRVSGPSRADGPKRLHKLAQARVHRRLSLLHPGHRRDNLAHVSAEIAIGELLLPWLSLLWSQGPHPEPPCPFTPLLGIFRLGAWPFVLPGGVMGIYLPRPSALDEDIVFEREPTRSLERFPGLRWLPIGK